jgi:cytochrome P450
MQAALAHGPIVQMRLGSWEYFLLTSPGAIRHVLQEHPTRYEKSPFYRKLWPVFGQGLVTSEGEVWRRHRRTIQPSFGRARLEAMVSAIAEETMAHCDAWATHRAAPLDLVDAMTALTERILLRVIFGGASLDALGSREDRTSDFVFINEEIGRRFFAWTSLSELLPLPRNLRFRRLLRRRLAMVDAMIRERRALPERGDDFLGALLAARDEETGEGFSDAELRDEIMTMFFAGHETTALALSWLWILLARHPSARGVVETASAAGLAAGPIDAAALARFGPVKMAVQEAMRLYPPAPWFSRTALEDDEIEGVFVPRDAIVSVLPWVMHRHPAYWDEPERFDPERFAPALANERDRLVYLPFGAGPRQCIGTHFAMMEATIIAAVMASRFRVELVGDAIPAPEPMITLRPRGTVQVRLHAHDGR